MLDEYAFGFGEGGESTEKALSFVGKILDLDSFDRLVADQKQRQELACSLGVDE